VYLKYKNKQDRIILLINNPIYYQFLPKKNDAGMLTCFFYAVRNFFFLRSIKYKTSDQVIFDSI
jgi:hypothetical protein